MRDGERLATHPPAKRIYAARGMPTTEAGIVTTSGPARSTSRSAIPSKAPTRSSSPLVEAAGDLIWLGTVLMMIGGLFSLSDRRLRIGAPNRRREAPASACRGGIGCRKHETASGCSLRASLR
jgi:cytochrome c-type biogenesis protein CcmF